MSVQAIARTPAGAVRIVDQTALPDAFVTRDLDTVDQMAEAIRALRVRGAPLIGIAAAMGLVAGRGISAVLRGRSSWPASTHWRPSLRRPAPLR